MLCQILIEAETPGDLRTTLRLSIDANVIAEKLTALQAHLLVWEVIERIAVVEVGKPLERRSASPVAGRTRWRRYG